MSNSHLFSDLNDSNLLSSSDSPILPASPILPDSPILPASQILPAYSILSDSLIISDFSFSTNNNCLTSTSFPSSNIQGSLDIIDEGTFRNLFSLLSYQFNNVLPSQITDEVDTNRPNTFQYIKLKVPSHICANAIFKNFSHLYLDDKDLPFHIRYDEKINNKEIIAGTIQF